MSINQGRPVKGDEYEYVCERGHWQVSPIALERCMAYRHGSSCLGELKRIGKGSRRQPAHRNDEARATGGQYA